MKLIKRILLEARNEVGNNPVLYSVACIILAIAFYFRVYRLDQLIGFYYDQGRDALVVWDFWHKGELFLIGPTTGIAGIFRGPFYYWLIAPFYLLGGGNPVWPSVFLSLTTVVAIVLAMYLAKQIGGWGSAIIVGILTGFSFYMVNSSRWLSNPTPMHVISTMLAFSLFQILRSRKWYWAIVGLLLGLAMQFGSAAEIFYFVSVGVFAFWQRKLLPSFKIIFIGATLLLLTFVPQIVFDIKHDGILSDNIKKFLFQDESFKLSFWEIVKIRLDLYKSVFFSKLFPVDMTPWKYTLGLMIFSLGINWKKLVLNKQFLTVLLLITAPLIGMLFFQGNHGNVYDYYFTGYYIIFLILVAVLLGLMLKRWWGIVFVAMFLVTFWSQNFNLTRNYIKAGVDGSNHVTIGNQLQIVNWVLEDVKLRNKEFNVDVYVPPVIPFAYDYLFLWQTTKRCGEARCGQVLDRQVELLYTIYEVDGPHPERLEAWLNRQAGIGVVQEVKRFGGISVERRLRTFMVKK